MLADGLSVLIVDDNLANQRLLAAMVRSVGVERIDTAMDGQQGLDAIRRHRPDLVLLDVMMPVMDGYEMCRRLRHELDHSELPVLFVTALDSPDARANCFAAGGTDMVSKPLNVAEVAARLRVHLENRTLLGDLKAYQARMREELDLARATQQSLLPDGRQLSEIRERTGVKARGVAVTSSELGGDFWTAYETHSGKVGLLVADFTGHGVAAAFNAVRLHALMSRRPWRLNGPAELLDFLNHELNMLLSPGQFAAALACELDPRDGVLTCAGAMAPQPILVEGGAARYLEVSGPPLGAFEDAGFEEVSTVMGRGAMLLAYSDALVESMVGDELVVDEAGLLDWALELPMAADPAQALLEKFHQRLPGLPPDDLTLVTLLNHGRSA